MVKIRLRRGGKKFLSYYTMVVADTRSPAGGKFIEKVGTYDPHTKNCEINAERLLYWLGVGAQPSDIVKRLLKEKKLWSTFKDSKQNPTKEIAHS